jgi:hypothetical protein
MPYVHGTPQRLLETREPASSGGLPASVELREESDKLNEALEGI